MNFEVESFLKSLLDPEKYGHAVTAEVRDEARALLGMKEVETKLIKVGFDLEEL
jgi:hypothetical protein